MGQNASDVHREMPENLPVYPARIDPLTSLRFFAALAVFAYHIDLVTPVEIPCRRLVRNMGQSRTQMTASLTESSKVN